MTIGFAWVDRLLFGSEGLSGTRELDVDGEADCSALFFPEEGTFLTGVDDEEDPLEDSILDALPSFVVELMTFMDEGMEEENRKEIWRTTPS